MSQLKLYRPDDLDAETHLEVDAPPPTVLRFRRMPSQEGPGGLMDVLLRARVIHQNKHCPRCEHPVVEPVVLNDAILNRGRLPIPGTGTLVGFHCHGCQTEWPVPQR